MSIFAKTNPIGLDAVIAQIQSKLMTLATKWGVELDGYPRCYPLMWNEKKGIEHYVSNNQYSGNLIVGERNKFFFTAENDEETVGNGFETTEIELYFILNLTQCKPSILHRADNEARVDVKNVLRMVSGINVDSTVIEIDRVFSGYDYQIGDDMQPYHAFRINLTAYQYDINQPYCQI